MVWHYSNLPQIKGHRGTNKELQYINWSQRGNFCEHQDSKVTKGFAYLAGSNLIIVYLSWWSGLYPRISSQKSLVMTFCFEISRGILVSSKIACSRGLNVSEFVWQNEKMTTIIIMFCSLMMIQVCVLLLIYGNGLN